MMMTLVSLIVAKSIFLRVGWRGTNLSWPFEHNLTWFSYPIYIFPFEAVISLSKRLFSHFCTSRIIQNANSSSPSKLLAIATISLSVSNLGSLFRSTRYKGILGTYDSGIMPFAIAARNTALILTNFLLTPRLILSSSQWYHLA